MNAPRRGRSTELHLSPGIQLMRNARETAEDLQQDVWQWATEVRELTQSGLSLHDLRWLLSQNLTLHGEELTAPGDERRRFALIHSLALLRRSCFVLTETGYRWACGSPATQTTTEKESQNHLPIPSDVGFSNPDWVVRNEARKSGPARDAFRPDWDLKQRMLRVGDVVVKRIRLGSDLQELILTSFQELGWPAFMYNPLRAALHPTSQKRLHHAVQNLNRAQRTRLLQFSVSGSGTKICWRILGAAMASPGS